MRYPKYTTIAEVHVPGLHIVVKTVGNELEATIATPQGPRQEAAVLYGASLVRDLMNTLSVAPNILPQPEPADLEDESL